MNNKDKGYSFSVSYNDINNRVKGIKIDCLKNDISEAVNKFTKETNIKKENILGIVRNI